MVGSGGFCRLVGVGEKRKSLCAGVGGGEGEGRGGVVFWFGFFFEGGEVVVLGVFCGGGGGGEKRKCLGGGGGGVGSCKCVCLRWLRVFLGWIWGQKTDQKRPKPT